MKSKQDHINHLCVRIARNTAHMKTSKGKLFEHHRSMIVAAGLELALLTYDKKRAEKVGAPKLPDGVSA
jgi:hypothetical protein